MYNKGKADGQASVSVNWKTIITTDTGGRFNSYILISELKKFNKIILNQKICGYSSQTNQNGWVQTPINAGDITATIKNSNYTYLWNRQLSESGYNGIIDLTLS